MALAHIELAKAEATEIGYQVARVAGLIGGAIVLVLFAINLIVVGTSLFLSEWLLGSMGWGVVHGTLLFVGVAVTCVLLAVGIAADRLARAFALGVLVAVVLSFVFDLWLFNQLYATIASNVAPGLDPGTAPLVIGLFIGLIVGLILGLVAAINAVSTGGSRALVIVAGGVLGTAIGAFTAITFQYQIGIGIAIAIGYVTWIALMAIDVSRTGIDVEGLQARFIPTQTIETSKETLEWLKQRMPPGIGS
jgi:hypothetical protein